MRVSTRVDYALRALVAIAQRPAGSRVSADSAADEAGLPRRFVQQQITVLAGNSIVECRRGAGGGCVLARGADLISVGDVVRALQGAVLDVPRNTGSAVAEMWAQAARSLETALDGVTLADLVARQRALETQRAPVYYI